jgi:RNA polymerase sigma-70 factor (ECF subfamily)
MIKLKKMKLFSFFICIITERGGEYMENQPQACGDWIFSEIIGKYGGMVYRVALSQTKNIPDAEDIFQDVFLKFFQTNGAGKTEEHIKAWLIRVTVNKCKNLFTSAWRKNKAEFPINLSYEDRPGNYELLDTVRKLPKKYGIVIHLFYYEDLPIAKISEYLKLNENTVKTRLSRAKELLKRALREEEDFFNV